MSSSSGKTVTTSYQSGPDDSLIVKDGYEGNRPYSGTKTNTSYDELRDGAIEVLTTMKDNVEQFETELAEVNENISATGGSTPDSPFDKRESYKRMSGGNSAVLGALNSLSSSGSESFNLTKSSSNVSNSNSKVKSDLSIDDINALVKIISSLSGNKFESNVVDKGATTALVSQTITAASSAGIKDGFQALVKNESLDRSILTDAAVSSIKDTVALGNYEVVKDTAKAGLLTDAIVKEPSLIKTIFSSNVVNGIELQEKISLYSLLRDSLYSYNNNWNKTTQNQREITDTKGIRIAKGLLDLIGAEIFSLPLTVYPGNDLTINPLVDMQLDPLLNSGIIEAIYGNDLTETEKNTLIEEWNKAEEQKILTDYEQAVDFYVAAQFFNFTVEQELNMHFKYLDIKTNKPFYKT